MNGRKHVTLPPLTFPRRLLLAPLLFVLLSHSRAEAGCPDRSHDRAMESS